MAKKKKSKSCSFKDYVAGKCQHKGGKHGLDWAVTGRLNLSGEGGADAGGIPGMGESFDMSDLPPNLGKLKDFWREDEYEDDDFDDDEYEDDDFDDDEYEEEQESALPGQGSKKDQARQLYRSLRASNISRKEIIAQFQNSLQLTPSSAEAYYERIAKEFGETTPRDQPTTPGGIPGAGGMGGPQAGGVGAYGDPYGGMGDQEGELGPDGKPLDQMEKQEWEDPNRQGVIRRVPGAHLVFKRQTDDGSFEELWVFKQGNKFEDELNVRRDILAGTDIPVNKTRSEDGRQRSELWSSGNMQMLSVTGLPN